MAGKDDYDKIRMAGKVWENPCVTHMAAEIFSDLSCMAGERHDDSCDLCPTLGEKYGVAIMLS